MEKTKNNGKKARKLNSMWIALIAVVAVIAGIIGAVQISKAANKSPGEKLFDSYVSAASKQNVAKLAETIYDKDSEEYAAFVEGYTQGKSAFEQFCDANPRDSKEYKDFLAAPVNAIDPKEYGLILSVEQQIARDIKSYDVKTIRSTTYYIELQVTFKLKEDFNSANYPNKYSSLVSESLDRPFTVKFWKKDSKSKWKFKSVFTLLSRYQVVETWYAPYGDGVELMHVNPDDIDEEGFFDASVSPEGKKVLAIGDNAFAVSLLSYGPELKSVKLSDSLQRIGEYAFKDCRELTEITFETDKTASGGDETRDFIVGDGAFYGCEQLKTFTLPAKNKMIPSYLFYNCISLGKFTVLDGVTSIGHFAFYGCEQLTEINIKNGVTTIGNGAFSGCVKLNTVSNGNMLPDSLIRLGADAFMDCRALKEITLPDAMTVLEKGLFSGCRSLAKLPMPSNLKTIGRNALSGTALSAINIPKTVETIGIGAFSNTLALQAIIWADKPNIRVIGAQAFAGCEKMYEFTLPKTIAEIGAQAFAGCDSLRVVMVDCSAKISLGESAFQEQNGIPKFYVNKKADYQTSEWKVLNVEIYDKSIIQGDFAIEDQTRTVMNGTGRAQLVEKVLIQYLGNKKEVNLNESDITRIGGGAFAYSQHVEKLIFDSDKITAIGENAFAGCNDSIFTKVDGAENDSLYYIGGWLIKGANTSTSNATPYSGNTLDLRRVGNSLGFKNLPDTKGVAAGSFKNCQVKYIMLPVSLKYLGDGAFKDSSDLVSADFETGESKLIEIGDGVFENCEFLVSFIVPESVTSIGERAFYSPDGSNLRFVIINNGEKTLLGAEAFKSVHDILKVYINGYNISEYYKYDAGWKVYKDSIYDSGIINSNLKLALLPNAENTQTTLIQYLGLESEDDVIKTTVDLSVLNITAIYTGAFATAYMGGVILPACLETIGDYAFYKCSALTYVRLSANDGVNALMSIGKYAFSDCVGLTDQFAEFIIEANQPNKDFVMGEGVFDPDVVRKIKVGARSLYLKEGSPWEKYKDALNAEDDPYITVVLELIGTDKINKNRVNSSDERTRDIYNAPGAEMQLVATVDTANGYVFDGWYLNGELMFEDLTILTVTAVFGNSISDSKTYEAKFKRVGTPKVVFVDEDDANRGHIVWVTPSVEPQGDFLALGSKITLKAEAYAGYVFAGWWVNGVYVENATEVWEFTITDDITIQALFEVKTGG